jgi:hypothetical protein
MISIEMYGGQLRCDEGMSDTRGKPYPHHRVPRGCFDADLDTLLVFSMRRIAAQSVSALWCICTLSLDSSLPAGAGAVLADSCCTGACAGLLPSPALDFDACLSAGIAVGAAFFFRAMLDALLPAPLAVVQPPLLSGLLHRVVGGAAHACPHTSEAHCVRYTRSMRSVLRPKPEPVRRAD